LVEKRERGAPLEIHTPVAIAEIRGTIVSVTVDPATGDSTFALEEGEARIGPRDPSGGKAVTLEAGQQVTFRANGQVAVVEPLQAQDIAQRAGCLDDFHHRGASARLARAEREAAATEEIVAIDIQEFALPPVGAGGATDQTIPVDTKELSPVTCVCCPGSVCDPDVPDIVKPKPPPPPATLPGAPPNTIPGNHARIP
jgi:hypothetical protein